MSHSRSFKHLLIMGVASTLISACASQEPISVGIESQALTPRITANATALDDVTATERAQLQLISTNLVAALVQIPEMRPATATLQVSEPQSAFGNAIVRALEDAGFGMQLVSADQGRNYVSYSKRLSETESGLVTDYELAVGRVRLSREYIIEGDAVYPSSLMNVTGTTSIADIALADNIFAEQGGNNTAFISGAQRTGTPNPDLTVKTVDVMDFNELPLDKRTPQDRVFAEARVRYFQADARRSAPNLSRYNKYRRTVLIFDDNSTQMMGNANKRAVRLLVREFSDDDIMVIKACQDADGSDDASMNRAIRVEEELAGFGVPTESAYIAPCARTSYRHASDNSPTPVELLHYRPK